MLLKEMSTNPAYFQRNLRDIRDFPAASDFFNTAYQLNPPMG